MSDNTTADDVDSANMFMSMLICDQGLVLSFHTMAFFIKKKPTLLQNEDTEKITIYETTYFTMWSQLYAQFQAMKCRCNSLAFALFVCIRKWCKWVFTRNEINSS